MSQGLDVLNVEEARGMTTFQQIELLERIVNDSQFHQNLPSGTIPYIKEALGKVDKAAFQVRLKLKCAMEAAYMIDSGRISPTTIWQVLEAVDENGEKVISLDDERGIIVAGMMISYEIVVILQFLKPGMVQIEIVK